VNELWSKYCDNPVLVLVNVEDQDELALPTEAYVAVEEILANGVIAKQFMHIPTTIEAFEAEEVGVEHLLREIKDINVNTVSTDVT
jgi:26S proteasome regulatory subunit N8